jgi:hypothetical protein
MYIGDGPPSSPAVGEVWWESDTGNMFIWYDDGNSQQWVPSNVGALPTGSGGGGGAMTGTEILTALAPVDGGGSGLDADKLDGQDSSYYGTAADIAGLNTWNSSQDTQLSNLVAVNDDQQNDINLSLSRLGVKITVASSAPSSPSLNDIWVDTT